MSGQLISEFQYFCQAFGGFLDLFFLVAG